MAQPADLAPPPPAPDMAPNCGHLGNACCVDSIGVTSCSDQWTICDGRSASSTYNTCIRCGFLNTACCALPNSCGTGLKCVSSSWGELICQ
jgi:hypothetical protein